MTKKELKRKCCICKKVTYNADTFGIWLQKGKHKGKWVEYSCISKT